MAMFEVAPGPRLFGLAPGVDFPAELVRGLQARLQGHPPEDMARVHLIVNTRRMARRIRDIFDQGAPGFLPQISLITEYGNLSAPGLALASTSELRRRLELTRLVSLLLDQAPDLAPRASVYDLADSLADLLSEMQGEGVSADRISALDVSDQSGHWDRAKRFLDIVTQYIDASQGAPDPESRQRRVVEALADQWHSEPPTHPVILAGSTGSRGTTQILMRAIARLPQGGVVLPGVDMSTPPSVWEAMGHALDSEDHPQFRFAHLATSLDMDASEIRNWTDASPPVPERNAVVSLAMRPAPVTDQWRAEGPTLRHIDRAMRDVTLLEAPSSRHEALAIALRLRAAVEEGRSAALITPDRMLTRQVTAALDRWNITPDDSAGEPLHLSPPGRFLRLVGALPHRRLSSDALIAVLKHPLTNSTAERGPHLLMTHALELNLRRRGPPYPTPESLRAWATKQNGDAVGPWVEWIISALPSVQTQEESSLTDHVARHIERAERFARGPASLGTGTLWEGQSGREAFSAVSELLAEAPHGGAITGREYETLFTAILSRQEVRNPDAPHPLIRIWGTLEARVQGSDLLIIAGLNEGAWPEVPTPDPWLNRKMRHDAGLLLPERRIGLSAHDFQQAICAKEVWLTRSARSDDAETVPSRWLNRLGNLMKGLPDQGGQTAWDGMRERGAHWLSLARTLEQAESVEPAARPSPRPPLTARPRQLSVTEIRRLIRDPYAIYARHVLRLRRLDPLMRLPDALARGIALHTVLENFTKACAEDPSQRTPANLMALAEAQLDELVPWADARLAWLARLERVSDWFIQGETERATKAMRSLFEVSGKASLDDLGFTLTAKADRVDLDHDGRLRIYDYKTGAPPTKSQQKIFDKQLLLEAAIAEFGSFADLPSGTEVVRAAYIGLGAKPTEVDAPLDEILPSEVWADLHKLMTRYLSDSQGFTARRAMFETREASDYDQLSRFGEWDASSPAKPEDLT